MKRLMFLLLALVAIFSFSVTGFSYDIPKFPDTPIQNSPVTFADPPSEGGDDNSGLIGMLLDGLIGLFVPSNEYFSSFWNEISYAVDVKVVSLKATLSRITSEFNSLVNSNEQISIKLAIPDNHFYVGFKGFEVDFLENAKPFLDFLRPIINGFVAVLLTLYCYRTVTTMFGE